MKLALVEVGGCPALISQLCEKTCSKQLARSWRQNERGDTGDQAPCMVGYYLKPLGESRGR
ncbi:MAG: hypothetical protein GX376_07765 [Firmicutes bacterium]|nr:hypothetical protein [Bacillota bacterium]